MTFENIVLFGGILLPFVLKLLYSKGYYKTARVFAVAGCSLWAIGLWVMGLAPILALLVLTALILFVVYHYERKPRQT